MLAQIIDKKVNAGALEVTDYPDLLKHFEVPSYLWLFVANLSQIAEVSEIISLAVAGEAISRYLKDSLRRVRRSIQQYGIGDSYVLDQVNVKGKSKKQQKLVEDIIT